MTFLERLLDGAGVAWVTLGELGEFIRGSGLQKKDLTESGFPAIHYGQIHTKYGLSATETFSFVSDGVADRFKKARNNDLLLATTSENDEDVGKPLAWLGGDVAISGDMMLFRHSQNVKYLAHFVRTVAFQDQKIRFITGAKVRRISSGDLAKITVPIPCPENPEKSLAIQVEIVRILDSFTELTADLTAELTAELTARRKQYHHYRDQLLRFEEREVEWKTLGEITELRRGRVISKQYLAENEGEYPVYSSQTANNGEIGSIDTFDFDGEYVNWTTDGANAGTVFYRNGKFSITNVSGIIKVPESEKLSCRFLFYWLSVEAKKHVYSGMGNPKLMSNQVAKIPVPILPETEQARIISILDQFDTLTQSLTEGLPREIELRQKQYAYYRDLLFDFPRPDGAATGG